MKNEHELPPSLAFCIASNLFGSGSEWYRAHRAAHVLGHELDWLTFVSSRFAPPEKSGESWGIEVEQKAFCPQVVILRPGLVQQGDKRDEIEQVESLTQSIAYAQEAGQIVLADIDDHPFAWNGEFARREDVSRIEDWSWYDRWIGQFNAVLCSTEWLVQFLGDRYPDQTFAYAPNLYDPYRYCPDRASFGGVLGSHLYVKSRLSDDFQRLGHYLHDFPCTFRHLGEEFYCGSCGHPRRHHFEDIAECEECSCEAMLETVQSSLAQAAGLPNEWIERLPGCSPAELSEKIDWNVGIVPMADSEFNYAKTEGKGFEMAAAGVPFIALTGEHPLYRVSPGWVGDSIEAVHDALRVLTTDPWSWAECSKLQNEWVHMLAQQHQLDYIATLRELSQSDLRK